MWRKARSQPFSQSPPPPRGGGCSCLLAQGRETNVLRQNKRREHTENPTEPFRPGSEHFQWPETSSQLLEPQHSCLSHTQAIRPATATAGPSSLTFPMCAQTINPLGNRLACFWWGGGQGNSFILEAQDLSHQPGSHFPSPGYSLFLI